MSLAEKSYLEELNRETELISAAFAALDSIPWDTGLQSFKFMPFENVDNSNLLTIHANDPGLADMSIKVTSNKHQKNGLDDLSVNSNYSLATNISLMTVSLFISVLSVIVWISYVAKTFRSAQSKKALGQNLTIIEKAVFVTFSVVNYFNLTKVLRLAQGNFQDTIV